MKKRFVSLLLAISMVLTFLPVSAITAFAADPASGEVGYKFTAENGVKYTVTKAAEGNDAGEVKVSQGQSLSGEITIPGTVTDDDENSYRVTSVDYSAFKNCKQLESVILPKNITQLPISLFEGCSALENVTIPTSVTTIGSYAFQDCTSLTEIELPAGITTISNSAFTGSGLTSIIIPDSIVAIQPSAFRWCENLENVTFLGGITYINGDTFGNCNKLTTVTIPGSVTGINSNAFTSTKGSCPLTTINYTGTHEQWSTLMNSELNETVASLLQKVEPAAVTIDADKNCGIDDMVSLTVNVAKNSNGSKAVLKVTDDDQIINTLTAYNQSVSNGDEITLNADNTSALLNVTFKKAGSCTFTVEAKTSDNRVADTKSATITVNSYTCKISIENPDNVVIVSNMGRLENNELSITLGSSNTEKVKLAVAQPDKDYTYKWVVDNDADKAQMGSNCVINVTKDTKNIKVTLTRIQKLTKDDLTINIPNGEYDGTEKKVTVSDKNGNDVSCDVTYAKEGETTGSADAPKDAGTYKVTITIKGDEHDGETIDAGTLTIKPATADTNDFEVTLPSGEADGTEKLATVTVPDGSIFKSDDVTIKKSYQVKDGDTWKDVEAPVSAGDYKLIVSVVSNDKNISSTDDTPLEWTFTIKEKSAPTTPEDPNKGNDKPSMEPEKPSTEPEKPAPKPEEKPEQKMKITGSSNSVKMKVNGEDVTPDEDGNITIREGDEVTITFDKRTLSDAQVFDQWVITPASVLNEVDPTAETITFTMPAEAVTIEAMTRDASIDPVTAQILGTSSAIVVGGASAAVLGYTGYMIGTELYLNVVLPDGAVIPQNYGELAKLVWTDAGRPEPVALLAADATDEQKAMTWAVENQLISADKAADASVTRWEVIQTWNKAQEMKH